MKIKNIVAILAVTFSLASCIPATKGIPQNIETSVATTIAADTFSFIFTSFYCGTDIFDSQSATLTHTLLGETVPIEIPFQLSSTEMDEIFQRITTMDFINLPTEFTIPDGYTSRMTTPTGTYELSVINGTQSNTVHWTTGTSFESEYEKANQLWELLMHIQSTIHSHPEYQQLPKSKFACI
jgi:hypothetical protein